MLCLKRKELQRVMLDHPDGTRIIVQVVSIGRGEIKIGFIAPAHIVIAREELLVTQPEKGVAP